MYNGIKLMGLKGEVIMNITVSGRQVKLTEELKGYINEKLIRLESYLDTTSQVKVIISKNKEMQKVEITISLSGSIIRAEQVQDDIYVAIDIVYEKLYKQLEKYKNKYKNRNIRVNGEYAFNNDIDCVEEDAIVENDILIERRKKFCIKPMSPKEAILQMELIGHKFYMFRNQYTYEINIAYKREFGGYGIIEHE